jgi:hypothetical protein
MNIDNYDKFHCSIGFIQQAYYFFLSCLPREEDDYPKKINGVYFDSAEHVKVYENELSYSFLLRIFGTLEELCNNLGLQDKKIPNIIKSSSNLNDNIKEDYSHIRNLRHVIAHGNGVGEITRGKYISYTKDHNGDLFIKIEELENFVATITSVAKELIEHANKNT